MSTITYTVKVASAKFTIDDAVAPKLSFRDGDTYVFDQADSSNTGHVLQFSITSNNSGSAEYTTGVTKTGTAGQAGAKTTIVTSGSTTDTLYYYSSGGGTYGEEFSNSGFNTTSEGILKPIVGAEATSEKWGPMVNHAIDQIVDLTVPKSGGTFSGNVVMGADLKAGTIKAADGTAAITIANSTGKVTVAGDLQVSGTTVTIDAATLVVEDKNIEMAKIGTPTDANADGGGITLKGNATAPFTDKTILWENDTNQWNVNQKWTENAGSSAWHRPLTTMLGLG